MTELLWANEGGYERAAELDPLGLDQSLHELPAHNELAAVPWLMGVTSGAVRRAEALTHPDASIAAACLRDLDFLASSLLRHDIQPIERVEGLEGAMQQLGERAGMVPRSTITTYAAANPTGDRIRTFTGSYEENLFIGLLRDSYVQLDRATSALSRTALEDVHDPVAETTVIDALAVTSLGIDIMVDAIVGSNGVMKNITPEFFSNTIRPYFDPLVIGGDKYFAANGGQLPLSA